MQAIADLDKQRPAAAQRRRYLIDVVMQTPQRFSDAFRAAVEAELPAFAPAMLRARFHLWEIGFDRTDGRRPRPHLRAATAWCSRPRTNPRSPRRSTARRRRRAGGDVCHRCARQRALRLRGHRQPRRGRDRRLPDGAVAGIGAVGRAHHAQPHGVPRRGGARGRLPLGAARLGPCHRRSQRQRRHRRDQRAAGARGAGTQPGVEAVYSVGGGNTATVAAFERLGPRSAGFSFATTSTPTTGGCCAKAASRCCTTIYAPTPGWRCG